MKKVEKNMKKSKYKNILSASLAMAIAVPMMLSSVPIVNAEPGADTLSKKSTYDQTNPSYHYFYNQLNDESKKIYEAMEEMYESGIFARGEDYDLSKHGKVTDAQLKTFVSGSSKLIDDYGAARDAFQYDYPDVFYVDFSLLSVRVIKDGDGVLHGYLGAGRSDTYLLRTFTRDNIPDAIEKYEMTIENALKDLPTGAVEGETLAETQTFYIHDYLVKNMIYHYENEVDNADCNSRTAYDALVYGEGVCEAYTRGFKALMDRAGIPAVCVYGVYRSSEKVNEMHIWNYVQIDGKWYGVDITHDDPVIKGSNNKNSTYETREFCLVGELDLAQRHVPSGIMSTANYEFTYPKLELEDLREVSLYSDGDLVVKLKEDYYGEDTDEILKSGTIFVSYRGKNYTQNAAEGYYILSKFGQYYPESDEWNYSDWGYITPQYYDVSGEGMEPATPDPTMVPEGTSGEGYGEGYYVNFPLPHIMKAQFAVTTLAPTFKYENGTISGSLYYEGNPALLTVVSEEIYNKWGTYVAPPYPEKISPGMYVNMKIGQTYHVKAVYNDDLKDDGTGEGVNIKLSQISSFTGSAIAGEDYSKVENIKWDGERTVEFDFTPSKQYADNNSYYNLQITGVIGVKSGKKPVSINYACGYATSFCALGVGGFNWRIFGQPQLLDTSDIDTSDWQAYDMITGEKKDNLDILADLTNRLTLVTQEPSPSDSKKMTDMLEGEFSDEKFLTEKTYNIQLTLCKCMIIQTGQSVRVCVGFPAGYDYSSLDKGVTYKAYHYKVDPKTNQLTGEIEEIRCFVTEYGLIIECDSFSPFTIAAVKADEKEVINKTVIFQSDSNGAFYDGAKKLEGHDGFVELTSQASGKAAKEITIKANEGYVINSVVIDNKRIQLNGDTTEHTISFDYNDYEGQTLVAAAEFISAKVYEQDIENGFSNDIATADPDNTDKQPANPDTGNTDSSSKDDSGNTDSSSKEDTASSNSKKPSSKKPANNSNSTQTNSASNNNDNSAQEASASNNSNSSAQAASTVDSQTSLPPITGNNATEAGYKGQAGSVQKKDSANNKNSGSSGNPSDTNSLVSAPSNSDASTKDTTETEFISESADSTSGSSTTGTAGIAGVYDGVEGFVQTDVDDTSKGNGFLFIIAAVAIAGIVVAGIALIVMRKNENS